MKKYWMYRGFGLKIRSEIELPEMIPLEENKEQIWDVVIEYGEVFEKIKEPLIDETLYQFSHKEFACYIEEIGMIHSCEGKKITINLRKKNISEDEMTTIRGFILGVGIGFIAYQKGMIPIHGSTVIVDGQGIIISGDCGSGKTSLCHQYLKCGFTYTADDLSIVELSGSQGIVHHAYPQQRLCKDTAYHWNH